ncbi:MAG: large conductance mechanosensitive channel protein MscL [Clostridiales bacterium]|nr:large conductance mechanosensitive channel protein MscL [Clostridiales bacterium]
MAKNRGSKLLGEFKKFALRGNVIDLAVGVIIGGAFQKIVTSVVNDLIMPLVGLMTGGVNFNDQFVILKLPEGVTADQAAVSLEAAKQLGATTFNYGAFITAVIDFLIMAFVIFFLVKGINKLSDLRKKPEEPLAPVVRICPFCRMEIADEALRCPHCTSSLEEEGDFDTEAEEVH